MIGGLILLALSIIGFYVADIYTEVKGRPSFIVDEILNPPTPRPDAQPAKTSGEHDA